jgi:hypothetical protein
MFRCHETLPRNQSGVASKLHQALYGIGGGYVQLRKDPTEESAYYAEYGTREQLLETASKLPPVIEVTTEPAGFVPGVTYTFYLRPPKEVSQQCLTANTCMVSGVVVDENHVVEKFVKVKHCGAAFYHVTALVMSPAWQAAHARGCEVRLLYHHREEKPPHRVHRRLLIIAGTDVDLRELLPGGGGSADPGAAGARWEALAARMPHVVHLPGLGSRGRHFGIAMEHQRIRTKCGRCHRASGYDNHSPCLCCADSKASYEMRRDALARTGVPLADPQPGPHAVPVHVGSVDIAGVGAVVQGAAPLPSAENTVALSLDRRGAPSGPLSRDGPVLIDVRRAHAYVEPRDSRVLSRLRRAILYGGGADTSGAQLEAMVSVDGLYPALADSNSFGDSNTDGFHDIILAQQRVTRRTLLQPAERKVPQQGMSRLDKGLYGALSEGGTMLYAAVRGQWDHSVALPYLSPNLDVWSA